MTTLECQTPLPAAQWFPVADLPSRMHHEYLYVLLPTGTVKQALYTDDLVDELEGWAWGEYTDLARVEPLPVQPTHFFSPPQPPTA